MSRSYFTEDQKMITIPPEPWDNDSRYEMQNILYNKGYDIVCGLRLGADGKFHDAWVVQREDIPRLIEQLFRQRMAVEVQADGHGLASIIFVYNYPVSVVVTVVKRFQKNKEGSL